MSKKENTSLTLYFESRDHFIYVNFIIGNIHTPLVIFACFNYQIQKNNSLLYNSMNSRLVPSTLASSL